MIAIQVAIGIVLAYAIIVNQKRLLALGSTVAKGLTFLAVVGFLGWLAVAAVSLGGEYAKAIVPPETLRKAMLMLGLIPIFILFALATVGTWLLGGLIIGERPSVSFAKLGELESKADPKGGQGCLVYLFIGFGAMMLHYLLSYPMWAYTPVGDWYEAVDRYGRANGWDDGLSVLFGSLLVQWVWIPLGFYYLWQRMRGDPVSQEPDPGN